MAVPWGLIIFVVGVLYGWLTPGRQNKARMFVTGLIIGGVAALLLALVGAFLGQNPLGLGTDLWEFLLAFLVVTVVFVVGVWVGDFIEGRLHRPGQRRAA